MTEADTPMPGEDSGSLPDDQRDNGRSTADDLEVEVNPGLESDSSVPEEDDPEIEETEPQPT